MYEVRTTSENSLRIVCSIIVNKDKKVLSNRLKDKYLSLNYKIVHCDFHLKPPRHLKIIPRCMLLRRNVENYDFFPQMVSLPGLFCYISCLFILPLSVTPGGDADHKMKLGERFQSDPAPVNVKNLTPGEKYNVEDLTITVSDQCDQTQHRVKTKGEEIKLTVSDVLLTIL